MKILVIGGSGIIGSKIVRRFIESKNDVIYTYYENKIDVGIGHKLDIRKKDETIDIISKINADLIIHAAALTNVDLCEIDKKLADSINVEGTENIVTGCQRINCKIVYISTSFVFNGEKNKYFEEDEPSPTTYYGLTKLKGEKIVKNSKLSFLILRTDQPYDWKEKWQRTNSVLRVLQTLQERKILNEIMDWYNVPTYIPDFINALENLINCNLSGIYHVCGSDFVNRYEWSLSTAEIFGLDKNLIKPISSKSLNLPAKRVNVNLSNEKLFQKTGIKMMGIKDGIESMKNNNPLKEY
ncbi:SDR family oxidoreductase [Nitrosarchaeum koreense]|uniref:dTDP-4-dehydrorhamnose reductase n=1 Tax=Nitrosarchaeum koreense MY1 TaxID=1001994 RepID=F9CY98_9ARCH|nr:SDR family oxidoreductase [Nitrosarchaeum koreense]EGP92876.1 dTDP-4-dehydrorhamnose reductase [Nitrosarchaeum koreense MY1]